MAAIRVTTVLCQKVKSVLVKRLSQVAKEIGVEMSCSVYQDVLINAKYSKELLIHYKVYLIIICLLSRMIKDNYFHFRRDL